MDGWGVGVGMMDWSKLYLGGIHLDISVSASSSCCYDLVGICCLVHRVDAMTMVYVYRCI